MINPDLHWSHTNKTTPIRLPYNYFYLTRPMVGLLIKNNFKNNLTRE